MANRNMMTDNEMRELLDREARRFNTPAFIADDPVQFPRRFSSLADIEITSLLASAIAWGNRKMIVRDIEKLLGIMDHQPHAYLMERDWLTLPDANIHRTFFTRDLRAMLRGLYPIYKEYGTLQTYAAARGVGESTAPAWELARIINDSLIRENIGQKDVILSRCLPQNLADTALKRLNMALRWLVRNDGIVDLGVWDVIKPSQLYIPMDVHVGNVSRELGLLSRKANDRRAVEDLTSTLRHYNPADPVLYDFALFSLGITAKTK